MLCILQGAPLSLTHSWESIAALPPPSNLLLPRLTSRIHTVKDEAMNCLGFFLLSSLGICSLGVEEEKKPYNEDIHIQVSLLFFVCAM